MKCSSAKRIVSALAVIALTYFVITVVLHTYTDSTYQTHHSNGIPVEDGHQLQDHVIDASKSNSRFDNIVNERAFFSYPSFLSHEPKARNDKSEKVSKSANQPFRVKDKRSCRMENCFNFTRCSKFRVHIHPDEATISRSGMKRSLTYLSMLEAIRQTPFYTDDPNEACIFLLAYDTTDRDTISEVYDASLDDGLLRRLAHWNDGLNHVIINFFGGTWPSYDELSLGFDPGYAMIAKASSSVTAFRTGFDLSVPLISGNLTDSSWLRNRDAAAASPDDDNKRYLLGFKGKRYVLGIGSETRNALYHLSNRSAAGDILLLTTCRHGRNWQQFSDERCATDNGQYDQVDYATLLHDARFCLVPRGRRLGSFRFIESLASGCIPVVLSNDWVLPFDALIDWRVASVQLDERTLSIVPATIRLLAADRAAVAKLQRNVRSVYSRHFSSIDAIVNTLLQELQNRVSPVATA